MVGFFFLCPTGQLLQKISHAYSALTGIWIDSDYLRAPRFGFRTWSLAHFTPSRLFISTSTLIFTSAYNERAPITNERL
jgi:hypothetical protein